MKSRYKQYMDRQTVSPDLHARLLSLEERKVVRPLRWQRWAAVAASLVLVAGIGWFAMGQMRMGSKTSEQMLFTTAGEETAAGAEEEYDEEAAAMDAADAGAVEPAEQEEAEAMDTEKAAVEEAIPDELARYATDYVGDSVNVSHIAQNLDYPAGWQYHHVELQTAEEPYGLTICLTGGGAGSDFSLCAERCFALIGNLGVVTFADNDSGEPIAQFER